MIELIVIGLVLFIAGVGGTILYDKHKAKVEERNKRWEEMRKMSPPKPAPKPTAKPRPGPKATTTTKTRTRTVQTEKDFTSIEDLIAEIEKMKKRL